MKRTCKTCGGSMAGTHLWELYCSPVCRAARHTLPTEPPPLPADLAPAPGKTIPAPRPARPVSTARNGVGTFDPPKPAAPCPICGDRVPRGNGPRPRVYCSAPCAKKGRHASQRRTELERQEQRRRERCAPRTCPTCGASFRPAMQTGAAPTYCNPKCAPSYQGAKPTTKET